MIKTVTNKIKNEGIIAAIKETFAFSFRKIKYLKRNVHYSFYKLKANKGQYLTTIQGSKMLLNMNDVGISKELTLTGVHEKNSTEIYKEIIKDGMHIGEFGANIGYYALIASKLVGDTGFIYAFEPALANFEALEKNIKLNNKQKIFEIHNKGLGAENINLDFFVSSKGNMSSFIEREEYGDIKNIDKLKVQVIKPDEYFKNKKLDFVRMDVEGFEIEIINGMHEIMSRTNKPKGLFIEVHSELLHKRNGSAHEFIEKVCSYGYEIYKSFYRGKSEISTSSKLELLNHPMLEKGYWETFFVKI